MTDLRTPSAVNIVRAWLLTVQPVTAIVQRRILWKLQGVYPAIRLTDLGPIAHGPEEALTRVQVECWADDYDTAEDLAAKVAAAAAHARGTFTWDSGSGRLAGASVEAGPFSSPDLESERHRHQLDLGVWIYPLAP